jgi:hypothetical protein
MSGQRSSLLHVSTLVLTREQWTTPFRRNTGPPFERPQVPRCPRYRADPRSTVANRAPRQKLLRSRHETNVTFGTVVAALPPPPTPAILCRPSRGSVRVSAQGPRSRIRELSPHQHPIGSVEQGRPLAAHRLAGTLRGLAGIPTTAPPQFVAGRVYRTVQVDQGSSPQRRAIDIPLAGGSWFSQR